MLLGSGQTLPLLTVELDLPAQQPATLQAQLLRQGVGAYCGSLVYVFRLAKPVAGEVGFEDHKAFGTPKFTGEADLVARLNGVKDLAKRLDKVLRSESEMGSIKVRVPRVFRLAPAASGSTLVNGTLPRVTSMGMSATTDAREIIDIAAVVEASI